MALSREQLDAARQKVRQVFSGIEPPRLEERTSNTYEAGFAAGVEAAAFSVPAAFVAVYSVLETDAAEGEKR